jgi:hypothetical protein
MKSFQEVYHEKLQKTCADDAGAFTLMVFACVTINIYFPAEKVESVAGEIVDEIRGQKPGDSKSLKKDKSDLFNKTFLAFLSPVAVAAEPLTVSNPSIRMLKQQMKARYAQMKPFIPERDSPGRRTTGTCHWRRRPV